jgi:hypothetical protein
MSAGPRGSLLTVRERSPEHTRGKPGFLTHDDRVPRETDSTLEGDGFEPSVPLNIFGSGELSQLRIRP